MAKAKNWSKVKAKITNLAGKDNLKLIKDLYELSDQNASFMEARFLTGSIDTLKPYKKIIEDAMYPDVTKGHDVSLATGKKAISDYKKSTGDIYGTIELMMFYVECGHKFTCSYGDMWESFYDSLISVYYNILKLLDKHTQYKDKFRHRLEKVALESRNIGWGYSEVHSFFCEAFESA